jgi:O-antigen/teichoic acid export membrane protein
MFTLMRTRLKAYPVHLYHYFMYDSLRRNASLLIASQAINAVSAFVFWALCAHLFPAGDVGLSTAFISFGALVATFTNLGLPFTTIRFLATSKKRGELFTGSAYLVIAASVTGGLLSVALIKLIVSKLGFVQSSSYLSFLLVLLIVALSISALLDSTLLAFRKGQYVLGKALVVNVPRIVLLFIIGALAMRGIVTIYTVVLLFGIAYSVYVVIVRILVNESFRPTVREVFRHRGFAAGNYFGGIFAVLPVTLVPLIVLTKLGPEAAAYIYIPMQIAGFLGIIPNATSVSMIAEASQDEDAASHSRHFRNAFKHMYVILVPAFAVIAGLGWPILLVYGGSYASRGYIPLLMFAVASLFLAVTTLGDTWLSVKRRARAYVLMNGFNAVVVVGSVYVLASRGLAGVALGWLVGQLISALVYMGIFARGQLLFRNGS